MLILLRNLLTSFKKIKYNINKHQYICLFIKILSVCGTILIIIYVTVFVNNLRALFI